MNIYLPVACLCQRVGVSFRIWPAILFDTLANENANLSWVQHDNKKTSIFKIISVADATILSNAATVATIANTINIINTANTTNTTNTTKSTTISVATTIANTATIVVTTTISDTTTIATTATIVDTTAICDTTTVFDATTTVFDATTTIFYDTTTIFDATTTIFDTTSISDATTTVNTPNPTTISSATTIANTLSTANIASITAAETTNNKVSLHARAAWRPLYVRSVKESRRWRSTVSLNYKTRTQTRLKTSQRSALNLAQWHNISSFRKQRISLESYANNFLTKPFKFL